MGSVVSSPQTTVVSSLLCIMAPSCWVFVGDSRTVTPETGPFSASIKGVAEASKEAGYRIYAPLSTLGETECHSEVPSVESGRSGAATGLPACVNTSSPPNSII